MIPNSQKHLFKGILTCFGCENKTGVIRLLIIFHDRSKFSHIIQNVSPRTFHRCGRIVYFEKLAKYLTQILFLNPK